MEIIEYYSCSENKKFLDQIELCEWRAAKYLAALLKENRLAAELGGWAKLFMLTDGDELVSFLTLSANEDGLLN